MNERGVSLTEIMLALAVIGLMLVIGGEGFVAAAARQQGKIVTTELAAELRAARHIAMIRRERVRVVFRPETSSIWSECVDRPEDVIRQFNFADRKVVVESLSNGPSVTFYPSGRTATPTTITLRNAQQERSQLTVSLTGRISILRGVRS
ncbi:MAG TPA: GspH/FimT family pseudopilin [Nitrospiraceae bacterium]|nr:GspH/FimT family pseudopilin [Nitrospiraceae bacterium]